MPQRLRTAAAAVAATLVAGLLLAAPAAAVTGPKVVIIVGPVGSQTKWYKDHANRIYDAATAAGAEVVKVYSPRATWKRVKNAVDGANIIVYLGHGNGFPSPYSSVENTDRVNGWGLNRTTNGGNSDNWSTKMVYCGEKALLGTLTSSDGAAQWKKCGGRDDNDGINPAPNFVMIYSNACYTPGAGEGWDKKASQVTAMQRVANFSYPVLSMGAGAYFATDMHQGAEQIIEQIVANPDLPFGQIAMNANGYDADAQRHWEHPDLEGSEVWVQRTGSGDHRDFWFAYAGQPSLTPAGGTVELPPAPQVAKITPPPESKWADADARVRVLFDEPVVGVSGATLKIFDPSGHRVRARVRYLPDKRRGVIIPRDPLAPTTWYRVVLTGGVSAEDDGALVLGREWRFKTGSF